jgi:hypothetical protein
MRIPDDPAKRLTPDARGMTWAASFAARVDGRRLDHAPHSDSLAVPA